MAVPSEPAASGQPAGGPRGAPAQHPAGLLRGWSLVALLAWTALWFAIQAMLHAGIAWKPFFNLGGRLLFTGRYPGGLHVYAAHPKLQFGPLTLAAAGLLRLLGPDHGLVTAQVMMTILGLLTLMIVADIALAARPALASMPGSRWAMLTGAAIFMAAWQQLAVYYGHLDDALTLVLAAAALRAALSGRPALTGLALGLAADAKPWALVFLPVLLLSGGPGRWRSPVLAARPLNARYWAIAAACTAGVLLAAWLPFFIADPHTIAAFHYKIGNVPDSALRALGVTAAHTPPWDRAAQVIIGCALGTAAIVRGRWPAVLLLGAGARIALDPGVHGYYTASVLLGALIWDLVGARRPVPLWTAASFCALNLVRPLHASETVQGEFRLWIVVAWTLVILAGPGRWTWSSVTDSPDQPGGPAGATAAPTMPGPV